VIEAGVQDDWLCELVDGILVEKELNHEKSMPACGFISSTRITCGKISAS
jgi:hypothetical protein